ncbi:transcriptional regulator, TetR family [Quadrisphaera granulorum]|uniref:TetR family transcriptional regulator n=1 Tax=Quadrisphaera granulorum TaxID=317664 RepID=A0A316A9U8_9ACTN|nr:TetR family transcriptional regulator [Quadrisphaera granulorum]PWJ53770.1 TetR family transcriptional regulator [Quadrisphaera granulorum]SZE96527.1 transcriptional regulator, TetR family [Quadrisphaera granulorum]
MGEVTAPSGRRERKKVETRDALRDAARRLFAEQGVAATSIEQITEAADVSQRTFFRYFESKYDLLLPDLTALFDELEAALAERPRDEHPLTAYEAALIAVMARQAASGQGMTTLISGIDVSDPPVTARLARSFVIWEERLTDLFVARLSGAEAVTGNDQDDDERAEQLALRASVTAGIAVATTRAVVRWARRHPRVPPLARLQAVRSSFALARAGCPL